AADLIIDMLHKAPAIRDGIFARCAGAMPAIAAPIHAPTATAALHVLDKNVSPIIQPPAQPCRNSVVAQAHGRHAVDAGGDFQPGHITSYTGPISGVSQFSGGRCVAGSLRRSAIVSSVHCIAVKRCTIPISSTKRTLNHVAAMPSSQ